MFGVEIPGHQDRQSPAKTGGQVRSDQWAGRGNVLITWMESSQYLYGEGSGWKVVWANRKEGQGGGSESTQQAVEVNGLVPSYQSHLPIYEDGTDIVPKRRLIEFRRRGNTQKTIYYIHNMAKV
jgi:hypothetical protein